MFILIYPWLCSNSYVHTAEEKNLLFNKENVARPEHKNCHFNSIDFAGEAISGHSKRQHK